MEVAGQWRREWAGKAEYGKVTEGGVTRKVARAMEVLHASAPGAKVRVLRAAYHSTAGPGAPASSYLLHSSRRVISSGYNFIEPDTSLCKPLEISSTPFESSPELEVEKENYKVTEPDDFEISEPSKWRGSKNINSIRMPSEESSSTDNTSVIDVDYNIKNTLRKSSERHMPQNVQKRPTPVSSLLDAPVTLNTLKYKSLLNGSDSWNNRRKSYSFEETPEIEESSLRESDALTMESSTDSGICKSSEIVNDNSENSRHLERKTKMVDIHEETFKDWLSKNRQKSYINQVKPNREHIGGLERSEESNIILQSAGKVSITLPKSTKTVHDETKNSNISDDCDRRTKKVEFCKTELHFAAESGTVNIIATDEKPPPSSDFRKKRSVFVPMTDYIGDKAITLFGDRTDVFDISKKENSCFINDIKSIDENTAATKSILKNKIPKPKPYLLGENMAFGYSTDYTAEDDLSHNFAKPSRVSLINRQLQSERTINNESKTSMESEIDWSSFQKSNIRTNKIGPVISTDSNQNIDQRQSKKPQNEKDRSTTIKSKVKMLQMSPTPVHPKTRQLRESDLTYFGVVKPKKTISEERKHSLDSVYNEKDGNLLQSVKLVKLVSSVCNSEVDSDEAPDYENLPIKNNFTPKPAPRSRSKCDTHLEERGETRDLMPILERDIETITIQPRRIKLRQQVITPTTRSRSEPPKANRQKANETKSRAQSKINQVEGPVLARNNTITKERSQKSKISEGNVPEKRISVSPLYVNLKETKKKTDETVRNQNKEHTIQRKKIEKKCDDIKEHIKGSDHKNSCKSDNNLSATVKRADSGKRRTNDQSCERKKYKENRTKILVTPEKCPSKSSEAAYKKHKNVDKSSYEDKNSISPSSSTQRRRTSRKECVVNSEDSKNINKLQSGQEHKKIESSTLDANIIESSNKLKTRQKFAADTSKKLISKEEMNTHTKKIESPVKAHKIDKTNKHDNTLNKSNRSKYVINYDDKNGTVSSICKIKPGHVSPKKNKVVDYEYKDNLNDHISKKNNASKIDLPPSTKDGKSKLKSKFHGRQTCQIL